MEEACFSGNVLFSVLVEGGPILCCCFAGLPTQRWRGEPVVVLNPTEQRVEVGKPLQLQCAAMGVPAPAYQWYRNGNPLEHQRKKKLWVTLPWDSSETLAAEVGGGRSSLLEPQEPWRGCSKLCRWHPGCDRWQSLSPAHICLSLLARPPFFSRSSRMLSSLSPLCCGVVRNHSTYHPRCFER